MVQLLPNRLDTSFAAIADATRRGVLEQLGRADASITELAARFDMTLTGMKKHVSVLEQAGLVTTEKVGRVRTCRLGPRRRTRWNGCNPTPGGRIGRRREVANRRSIRGRERRLVGRNRSQTRVQVGTSMLGLHSLAPGGLPLRHGCTARG